MNAAGEFVIIGHAMRDEPRFYTPIQEFFDRTIIDGAFVYIDLWSVVHLAAGVTLGWMLGRRLRPVWALGWSVGLILGYEVVEMGLNDVVFVPETPVDLLWDIIVGVVGVAVALAVTKRDTGRA